MSRWRAAGLAALDLVMAAAAVGAVWAWLRILAGA